MGCLNRGHCKAYEPELLLSPVCPARLLATRQAGICRSCIRSPFLQPGSFVHQEVARLTAELKEGAAALKASKQQAKAAAASLAGLQPELAAARSAVAQHKETRRLTIERRSQVWGLHALASSFFAVSKFPYGS